MTDTIFQKPVPIIKWAGGKRQLIPQIIQMIPEGFNRYYEPFFGGGALFCELTPTHATINDSNKQLVGVYRQIKADPEGVCAALFDLQSQYNEKETMEEKDALYYRLRESFNGYIVNDADINHPLPAAILIFLNKAGFNGLYRVNASGMYNVPPAHRKSIKVYDRGNIMAMSKALKNAKIMCGDFANVCKNIEAEDFVFFDSPYYGTFDAYQACGFSETDHVRLFGWFKTLSDKGVFCMMTNSDCDFIKNLYKDFNIKVVDVKRMINCDGGNRMGKEIIVTNYNIKE